MTIAYFTASMNDPALLESIFTAREKLAEDLIDRVRQAVDADNRQYSLVTGPRGIGKTHLISLIYYRLKNNPALRDKLRIAWLVEDAYSVNSYAHLLREILVQLDREYGIPDWAERLALVQRMDTEYGREVALESDLLRFLEGRVLLILAENLDTIFDGLGDRGQERFRGFLQARGAATLLATSTSLLPDLQRRGKPFFGAFRSQPLAPFTFQECVDVMVRIARYRKDEPLAKLLESPKGRARIRSIHHIAGGNPRIYVIFYQFITRDSLDKLVGPFTKMVDDLVPYYQSRMQTISAQQRMLVDIIRRAESPIAVRDIANAAFITSQSASSDLRKLRELGYVNSTKFGRETLHELREPLMRICLGVKEQRGGALPLLIDFLRIWFTPSELKELTIPSQMVDFEKYQEAIREAAEREDAKIAYELSEILALNAPGDDEIALSRLKRLYERAPQSTLVWVSLFQRLRDREDYQTLAELFKERVALFPDSAEEWNYLNYAQFLIGNYEEALAASTRATTISPSAPAYWLNRLTNLDALGRVQQYDHVAGLALAAVSDTDTRDACYLRALCLHRLDNYREAAATIMKSIAAEHWRYADWRLLHVILVKLHADRARLWIAQFATRLFPGDPAAWRDYGTAYACNGDFENALAAHDRAVELAPEDANLRCERIRQAMWSADREAAERAAKDVRDRIEILAEVDPSTIESLALLQALRDDMPEAEATLTSYLEAIFRSDAIDTLGAPLVALRWSADPAVMRRVAALWVKVYARFDSLGHLGKALATTILSPAALFPDVVIRHWLEAWKPFAATHSALEIPLGLMDVAVRFRESRDRLVLMDLPVEQRSLLEPHLDRYLRSVGDGEHPIDAAIETLIKQVEAKRSKDNQSGDGSRGKAAPALSLDRLLRDYDARRRVETPLDRLFRGKWTSVPKREAASQVEILVTQERELKAQLARGKCRLLKLERTTLPFGRGHLYQAHIDKRGRIGAIDFWSDGERVMLFSGRSLETYALIEWGVFKVSPELMPSFLTWFCTSLRAEAGRFAVVLPDDETVAVLEKKAPDAKIIPPTRSGSGDSAIYTAAMVFDDWLFEVDLTYGGTPKVVRMIEDRPLSDEALGFPREDFDGPIRYWARARRRKAS